MIFYNQAVQNINQSNIASLYLLFGEEQLLADELVKKIKLKFLTKAESELNLFVRYATENGLDEIITLSSGMGLFSEKKLLILKEADALKTAEIERLEKVLSKPLPEICLILQTGKSNLNQTRLKKISEKFETVNLLPLKERELLGFVNSEFRKYNKTITREAASLLLFMVGNQLADIISQVRNVAGFSGEQAVVDVKQVEEVAGVYATHDVFELCKEIGNENYRQVSLILLNLIESGVSASYILAQILRHFNILWQISGYKRINFQQPQKLAGKLNIYYKYIDEYMQQSPRWTAARLKRVMNYIREADREIKNNNLEAQLILDLLTYKIIHSK